MTESEEAVSFFQQTSTKKDDFRAIRDLVELLNENGGLDADVEFDYKSGEFIVVVYTTPKNESLPFRKKYTKFPQLQNSPPWWPSYRKSLMRVRNYYLLLTLVIILSLNKRGRSKN